MSLLLDDRVLLARFRKGERAALETVYRHYAPRLAAFLRRGFSFSAGERTCRFTGVRAPFELEEVLQDVFVKALSDRARRAYSGLSPYEAYLRSIARYLVIDRFRAATQEAFRHVVFVEDTGGEDRSRTFDERLASLSVPPETGWDSRSQEPDPERAVASEELARQCVRFAEELPRRWRPIFRARFIDGMTQEDVAKRFRMTRWRVRSVEGRIRKRFLTFARAQGLLPWPADGGRAATPCCPAKEST